MYIKGSLNCIVTFQVQKISKCFCYTTPEFRSHNCLSSDVVHPSLLQSQSISNQYNLNIPLTLTQPEIFHHHGRELKTPIQLCPIAEALVAVSSAMEHCDFSSKETINSALKTLAITMNVPYRKLMLLCRLAVTGTMVKWYSNFILKPSHHHDYTDCCVDPISSPGMQPYTL